MIYCDICNGELTVAQGGQYAVCEKCGMKHTIERVKEKLNLDNGSLKATGYSTENINDNISVNEDTEIYDADFTPIDAEIVDAEIVDAEIVDAEIVDAEIVDDEIVDDEIVDDEIVDDEICEGVVLEEENIQPSNYEEFVKKIENVYNSQKFNGYEISRNIPASELGANEKCIPVNFLFKKNGAPVLAVLLLKVNRHSHIAVTGTMQACENKGIKVIYFYKDMPNKREYVLEKTIAGLTE